MTSIRLRVDRADDRHVHLSVFVGPAGCTRANAGKLCMSPGEYQILGAALLLGAQATNGHLVAECDDFPTESR